MLMVIWWALPVPDHSNQIVIVRWQKTLISVHGRFHQSDVPSFQMTSFYPLIVAINNSCSIPCDLMIFPHGMLCYSREVYTMWDQSPSMLLHSMFYSSSCLSYVAMSFCMFHTVSDILHQFSYLPESYVLGGLAFFSVVWIMFLF